MAQGQDTPAWKGSMLKAWVVAALVVTAIYTRPPRSELDRITGMPEKYQLPTLYKFGQMLDGFNYVYTADGSTRRDGSIIVARLAVTVQTSKNDRYHPWIGIFGVWIPLPFYPDNFVGKYGDWRPGYLPEYLNVLIGFLTVYLVQKMLPKAAYDMIFRVTLFPMSWVTSMLDSLTVNHLAMNIIWLFTIQANFRKDEHDDPDDPMFFKEDQMLWLLVWCSVGASILTVVQRKLHAGSAGLQSTSGAGAMMGVLVYCTIVFKDNAVDFFFQFPNAQYLVACFLVCQGLLYFRTGVAVNLAALVGGAAVGAAMAGRNDFVLWPVMQRLRILDPYW